MRRILTASIGLSLAITAAPAVAQSNNNDYTPLNSRIKRDRQFPLDLPSRYDPARMTRLMQSRGKDMLAQFSKCLYDRSNQQSLALLEKTDFGFVDFGQIGLQQDRAVRTYGFQDCMRRVANSHNVGVRLRFSPGSLRQWLLQQAYMDRYPDGPTWVKPGIVIGERNFPLSQNNGDIRAIMDFADCVVQNDPYNADYFFRSAADSEDEKAAIGGLASSLGPCLPQGQRAQLSPAPLRVWIGEALWHASANNTPAPAPASQDER